MSKVYALTWDEPDFYDVGTHDGILELFECRETAEQVRAGLIGKQMDNKRWGASYLLWEPDDLRVEEWVLR